MFNLMALIKFNYLVIGKSPGYKNSKVEEKE